MRGVTATSFTATSSNLSAMVAASVVEETLDWALLSDSDLGLPELVGGAVFILRVVTQLRSPTQWTDCYCHPVYA